MLFDDNDETQYKDATSLLNSLIGALAEKVSGWKNIVFSNLTNEQKFLWFNIIGFGFTFLFFSSSSTKLITYILPAYMFLAYICAFVWIEYIYENKFTRSLNITSYVMGAIFVLASITACFTKYFLPAQLYSDIYSAKWFCIILILAAGVSIILLTAKQKKLGVFITYVAFISILSAFGTKLFYNINYTFGQNDLMNFAKQEKELNHNIYVINNARKYSVLYYGEKATYVSTKNELFEASDKIFNQNSRAIIRNKDYEDISMKYNIELLQQGTKHSLVKFLSVKN